METNIADKLTELLNDPEGMERIKNVASSLFGGAESKQAPKPEDPQASFMPNIDPMMIMQFMSTFNNNENDSRANLLLALKPHLSPQRQERVDSAVKLLKLVSLMPLVKQFI